MIRVLSVDDHPLLREGIAARVNAESDMKLVAEAINGREAIEKFRSHRPARENWPARSSAPFCQWSGLAPGPSMPGSSAGNAWICRSARGAFFSP
jgi:hypothetical protein